MTRHEQDRENIRKAIGDARYEAWRCGLNPDAVDYDRISDDYFQTHSVEDASSAEVHRLAAEQHAREVARMKFEQGEPVEDDEQEQ